MLYELFNIFATNNCDDDCEKSDDVRRERYAK